MESAWQSEVAPHVRSPRPAAIARWLLAVAALVVVMVVVGGITRLTESGLSITEWDPVGGAVPPLDAADWDQAFALYKATPEYQQVNGPAGMDLAAFQRIYFWEWLHRLLGRVIGLAYGIPLVWFAIKRAIPDGYGTKLTAIFVLGAAQASMGWYMVLSGLRENTDVSHFRLSAHLLLAFLIIGALIWVARDLRRLAATGEDRPARLTPLASATLIILFIQLLYGAWVAGLNAGQVAASWPDMNGRFVPEGIDWSRGPGHALVNDPYLIHFIHRWWAWVAVAALVVLARRVRALDRRASIAIHSAFGVQILLGIATVLTGVALWLAALHQAVGALLVIATVWGAHVHGSGSPSPLAGEGGARRAAVGG